MDQTFLEKDKKKGVGCGHGKTVDKYLERGRILLHLAFTKLTKYLCPSEEVFFVERRITIGTVLI